jgi:hypothetical protein
MSSRSVYNCRPNDARATPSEAPDAPIIDVSPCCPPDPPEEQAIPVNVKPDAAHAAALRNLLLSIVIWLVLIGSILSDAYVQQRSDADPMP